MCSVPMKCFKSTCYIELSLPPQQIWVVVVTYDYDGFPGNSIWFDVIINKVFTCEHYLLYNLEW